MPGFLSATRHIRDAKWRVAPLPPDLCDRRDRKMVINALNSGANCFMADFEDSHSPTWIGTLDGQINVRDAVDGTIEYVQPDTQKHYRLNT
jgi:malate synthase